MRKIPMIATFAILAMFLAIGTVSAGSENASEFAQGRPWQLGYCGCPLCQTDDDPLTPGNQALFDPLCDPPGQGFVEGFPKSVNHGWCLGYLHLGHNPHGLPAPNW